MLRNLGPTKAVSLTRQQGVTVIGVLEWMEEEAKAGRLGWRVVVSAMAVATEAQDEAVGLLLIGNELRRAADAVKF